MYTWAMKRKESFKDFEKRKEKAIQEIKDKEIIATKSKKYKFTEKQLREEFDFDDMQKMYDKFDNFFTDGTFLIFPEDKVIEI